MATKIGKRSPALRVGSKRVRRLAAREIIFCVATSKARDVPDFAVFNHLARKRDQRVAQKIVPDDCLDARRFGGLTHSSSRFAVRRERLFAINRLSAIDRFQCDRFMQRVRRGDGDDIDIVGGRERPPIAGRALEAQFGCIARCRFLVNVRQPSEFDLSGKIEYSADGSKGICMAAPHEPCPDKADPQLRLVSGQFILRRP